MKPKTLIFCGQDGNAGKAMADKLRSEGALTVMLRDAVSFIGITDDPADSVVIMPDVSGRQRQLILDTYSNVMTPETVVDHKPPEPAVIKRGPGRPRKAVA